jgi:hypothetical protein
VGKFILGTVPPLPQELYVLAEVHGMDFL